MCGDIIISGSFSTSTIVYMYMYVRIRLHVDLYMCIYYTLKNVLWYLMCSNLPIHTEFNPLNPSCVCLYTRVLVFTQLCHHSVMSVGTDILFLFFTFHMHFILTPLLLYCLYLPMHSSIQWNLYNLGQKRKCPDFRGYIVHKLDVADSEMGLVYILISG